MRNRRRGDYIDFLSNRKGHHKRSVILSGSRALRDAESKNPEIFCLTDALAPFSTRTLATSPQPQREKRFELYWQHRNFRGSSTA